MKRDEVACEVRSSQPNLAAGIGHPECDNMNEETITSFAASLRGPLIRRGDAQYDEVRKLYNDQGYVNAAVDFSVTVESNNQAVVTLDIVEGGRLLIKRIAFEGNKAYSQS